MQIVANLTSTQATPEAEDPNDLELPIGGAGEDGDRMQPAMR